MRENGESESIFSRVVHDRAGRDVDLLDRPQPRHPDILLWERVVPGLLAQFDTVVPAQFWSAPIVVPGAVVVFCACDHVVVIDRPGTHRCCEGCDRAFLWTGEAVRRAHAPRG